MWGDLEGVKGRVGSKRDQNTLYGILKELKTISIDFFFLKLGTKCYYVPVTTLIARHMTVKRENIACMQFTSQCSKTEKQTSCLHIVVAFNLKFLFFIMYVCMCVSEFAFVHTSEMPMEARREHWILGTGVSGSCEPWKVGAGN